MRTNKKTGISLIVLVAVIAIVLILVAVLIVALKGNNKEQLVQGNEHEIEQVEEETEQNTSNTQFKLWVDDYNNWGEQKEKCDLVMFDGKCPVPIDMTTFDNYFTRYDYHIAYDGVKIYGDKTNQHTTKIKDVIECEELIDSGSNLWMYYGKIEEFKNYGHINSVKVDIENYNYNIKELEGHISLKDAIKNNWWYIEEGVYPEEALGINAEDEDYDDKENAVPLLNKVVDRLGGPKHIYTLKKVDEDWCRSRTYLLSYEYDEFVITIEVFEHAYEGYNVSGIDSVIYYTKDSFVKELSDMKYEIMK